MKKLMAANWKMYKTQGEAVDTLSSLQGLLKKLPAEREVAVFAPFTALAAARESLGANSRISLGGQDLYPAAEGAFTGEISPLMLKDCGCRFALTGHSERRQLIGESDELVGRKTAFALAEGLDVLLCVGETLAEREAGELEAVLKRQLHSGVQAAPKGLESWRLSIAYEPIWAIGTGRVAGPAEILEAHGLIRKFLGALFGENGHKIRILYGGSVKPDNAAEIIGLDNVDGVLVGGASLDAENFSKIVLA